MEITLKPETRVGYTSLSLQDDPRRGLLDLPMEELSKRGGGPRLLAAIGGCWRLTIRDVVEGR